MKRILSILLAAILCACQLMSAAHAFDAGEENDYPIIIVPGYSSSQLVRVNDDGTTDNVWYIDINTVLDVVKQNIPQLALGAGLLAAQQPDYLMDLLAPHLEHFLGPLACNHDGTSKYNIQPKIAPTAAASRWTELEEADRSLIGYLDEDVDLDRLYVFSCDFRMDAIENAKRLGLLIDDVLKTTGSKKVNLIAQSYGGQITGTYLSVNAKNAGKKVYNAVLIVPALGGATLAYDFFADEMWLDSSNLAKYLEYGFMNETDFHLLLNSEPDLKLVANLIHAAMPMLREIAGYWPGLWDFVPYPYYKELLSQLDPVESAPLIEKTTYFHENVMAKYHQNLTRAQKSGVNISIVAGSGNAAVSGMRENSDGILPVSGSTGATPAPYGKRYNDGYTCIGTNCSDPAHHHLSPSMEVDASTCYLPENTWIVDGYYHGLDRKDQFTFDLFRKQLLAKEPLKDVHSDPAFPQFHTTAPISLIVHAQFDHSPEGFVCDDDAALIIQNVSASPILITDVSVGGADIKFDVPFATVPSGGSRSVAFSGELPKQSLVRASVTVSYIILGTSSYTPVGHRTFDFTVMNGPAPAYDASEPYADADLAPQIYSVLSEDGIAAFEKYGLTELVNSFYTTIARFITVIRSVVSFFQSFSA